MIKVNDEIVHFSHFNDGSCRVQIKVPLSNNVNITWLYDNDTELLYLYYTVQHLRANFAHVCNLIMPYVPNGRMDRTRHEEEVFTLKYSCELINSLGFKRVIIFDPHSSVTPALLNNVIVRDPSKEIMFVLSKLPNALVFMPDEGSMKRISHFINVPYAFGVKERDWETQKINSLRIAGAARHQIAGHDILICDDILSRGSTIYSAAKQLKDMGANNIYVYVSHCEDTVLEPNINDQSLLDIPDLITKVYTTNSIFTASHPKIEIIREF